MPDFGSLFLKWWPTWAGQRERITQLEEKGLTQAATIEAQAQEVARLKTRLSQADSIADDLQRYASGLERKFILAPPSGDFWVSEAEASQHLPLPLTTRDNSRVVILPLAEWERFTAWAIPRVRNIRPYEVDVFDCAGMAQILLGLAEEWVPGLACGWVELTSPVQKIGHKMMWLLAIEGTMSLWYIDAVPRPIIPWPEGVFSEAVNEDETPWQLDRMGF